MRLGLIARADNGGLGTMTWEFSRHMQPDRVLGIDLGEHGRGETDWSRFPGAEVSYGMDSDLDPDLVHRFCKGLDVVYSAETWYRSDVPVIAEAAGCRTVLHAMPELWRADQAPPDVVWAPTTWRLDRLPPGTRVVPVPVASHRFRPRHRDGAKVLYHLGSPAMLDRNGTHLLLEAARRVRVPCHLVVGSAVTHFGEVLNNVTVDQRGPVEHYWERHPDEADVLVLPRRYAGLSLPMQECAAMGMAVVTLDLEPQRQWVHPVGLVPSYPWRESRMVNGKFIVHACDPGVLARVIDRLLEDREAVAASSGASLDWGHAHSWERWAPTYRDLLEAACG